MAALAAFVTACSDDAEDPTGSEQAESSEAGQDGPGWHTLARELPGALLSVWGTSATDVWTVGADPGDGQGPYVFHFDGESWQRRATASTGDLWWVTGTANGHTWMAGDAGRLLRHDRATQQFEIFDAPTRERIYGIFQIAPDDVWACGGDPRANTAVLWHFDGVDWRRPADLPDALIRDTVLFKIWGRGPQDLWFVGLSDKVLHYDGVAWQTFPLAETQRLLTIHGSPDRLVAVGGFGRALILENHGQGFFDNTPGLGGPALNGVYLSPSGEATAVGSQGVVLRQDAGDPVWKLDTTAPLIGVDLHGVYVDPSGGIWSAGGFLATENLTRGVLLHHGPSPVPALNP